MKILLSILLYVACVATLCAQEPDTILPGRDLIPLLPYIFFDSGSAVIPSRYVLFTSPEQTATFSEHAIHGDALELHHNILNILGERLRHYPSASVTIGGYNTTQPEIGETRETAYKRAEVVREYLRTIWGIDTSRLRLLGSAGLPRFVSNLRDPICIRENRRTEILSEEWEIIRPIFTERVATAGISSPTRDRYWIILFTFDSPQLGNLNERIFREYIFSNITTGAEITATAYTDLHYEPSRFMRLSMDRAMKCITIIKMNIGAARAATIKFHGEGSEDLIFPRGHPEAGFYNRCVLIDVVKN